MTSLRLLFYTHAPEVSGAERSLLSIAQAAQDRGHMVLLAAPPGPITEGAAACGVSVAAMPPLALGYTRNPMTLARYLAGAAGPSLALARLTRAYRPHIVHANSARAGLVAAAALRLAPPRPRPRLVVHTRDAFRAGLLSRLTARTVSHEAAAIVAISRYAAHGLGRSATVRVLHNAIDLSRYQRDEQAGAALRVRLGLMTPETPLLALVGQISPWKGQADALEALARVRAAGVQAHLMIAGSPKFVGKGRRYDNGAYQAALVARAGQADLRGHVHFLGEAPDPTPIYSAASALLVPSWAEPFGRVVIEAMACGCPVIATAAGGVPEIITDGSDGLLVPPRDPLALSAAILALLHDPDLARRLRENGCCTAMARFGLEAYMATLEDIWISTAGSHGTQQWSSRQ